MKKGARNFVVATCFLAIVVGLFYFLAPTKGTEGYSLSPSLADIPSRAQEMEEKDEGANSDTVVPLNTQPPKQNELDVAHREIRQEFDSVIGGNEEIDVYILRHLERAEAGDADSAIYVAEAMRYCLASVGMVERGIRQYQIQPAGPSETKEAILERLVGLSPYRRNEASLHIDRWIACKRSGWDNSYLTETAYKWEAFALNEGQPLAVARVSGLDPNAAVTPEKLEKSKAAMRQVLTKSREFTVLWYASSVVSVSTNRDFESEKLAWALLACEYDSCDSLNYYNRGLCEMQGKNGADYCTEDVTDMKYLFGRYPGKIDVARSRALFIKEAIDSGQWDLIGLD